MPNTTDVKCGRCGSEDVRASRQALNFVFCLYCLIYKRQRYRCLRCKESFYGPRRSRSARDSHDSYPGAAQRNGAG
jgi:DNA-directed RNA polymerase subunit RPC12/RpoP